VATVDDAIELLRDPENLRHIDAGSHEVMAVKADQVVRLLGMRGAATRHEALALVRQAAKALGGGEVIASRPAALAMDQFGSGQRSAKPSFWVPVD
jgi:hypothetical protein